MLIKILLMLALFFVVVDAVLALASLGARKWSQFFVCLLAGLATLYFYGMSLVMELSGGHGAPSQDGAALGYAVAAIAVQIFVLFGFDWSSKEK